MNGARTFCRLNALSVIKHHCHLDANRSAETSRHCDRPPERSILCHLQGLGHCDTRVTADLVKLNPGGGWPTTGTSPFLRWPLTISRLGTDSKDLIGWYGVWVSGNMAKTPLEISQIFLTVFGWQERHLAGKKSCVSSLLGTGLRWRDCGKLGELNAKSKRTIVLCCWELLLDGGNTVNQSYVRYLKPTYHQVGLFRKIALKNVYSDLISKHIL